MHDGMLLVHVSDDGVGGVDPRSRGLLGINDRVLALGGKLEMESRPGRGTRLTATMPLQPPLH